MTQAPKHFYNLVLGQLENISPPTTILDVGCGSGWTLRQLKKQWPHATLLGMDKDFKRIQTARFQALQEKQDVDFQIGNVQTLNSANFTSQFDLVLCHNVLAHLKDPLEQLHKLKAWLKPGGTLSIVVENPAGKWIEEQFKDAGYQLEDITHSSFRSELDHLMEEADSLLNNKVQKKTDQRVLYPLEDLNMWLEQLDFASVQLRGVSVILDYYQESHHHLNELCEVETVLSMHPHYQRLAYFYHFIACKS